MESVRKARLRMREAPKVLAQCKKESLVYAECVVNSYEVGTLNKDICMKEFANFKKCLSQVSLKIK